MNKDKFSEKLKSQATLLKFEISSDVFASLEEAYDFVSNEIEVLKSVDTTNVKPMTRIDDTPIIFDMREDIEEEALSKDAILSNAPKTQGNFIVVPKGVKND